MNANCTNFPSKNSDPFIHIQFFVIKKRDKVIYTCIYIYIYLIELLRISRIIFLIKNGNRTKTFHQVMVV